MFFLFNLITPLRTLRQLPVHEVVLELSGYAVLELKFSGLSVKLSATSLSVSAGQRSNSHGTLLLRHSQEYQTEWLLWRLRQREAFESGCFLASPPSTQPSMPPSTVSSFFSVTGVWKGGPWLGCGDLPALEEDSRGWLTTVEALGCSRHPHSF